MKQEIKDYECPFCHNHFMTTRGGFSNHIRYCNNNPKSKLNRQLTGLRQKQALNNKKQLEKSTKKNYTFVCKECSKQYDLILSDKQYYNHNYSDFCSISCARKFASNSVKNELKESKCIDCGKIIYIKTRASDKTCRCKECQDKHNINIIPVKTCIVCGTLFQRKHAICCSDECSQIYRKNRKQYLSEESLKKLQECGKKSAQIQSELRRSKNEIEFCKLCENYFNNVEHNKAIFNGWDADIIIHDIKYAILWNGKWHYEQIMSNISLKQIQNRDNIKCHEIENFGYKYYIIKDMGKYNPKFVQEEFNKFINIAGSTGVGTSSVS